MARPNDYYQQELQKEKLQTIPVAPSLPTEMPKLNPAATTSVNTVGLPTTPQPNLMQNIQKEGQKQQAVKEVMGVTQEQLDQNLKKVLDKAQYDSALKESNRSLASSLPYELLNTVVRMPDQGYWETGMTAWEKIKHVGTEVPKFLGRLTVDFGKELIKTPLVAQRGAQYLVEKGFDIIDKGVNKITGDDKESYRMGSEGYNLGVLGRVKGATDPYQEGIDAGLTPLQATIKATGEWAGTIAMTHSITEAFKATIFQPRLATVQRPVIGKDFRPLQSKQLEQVKYRADAKKLDTGVIEFGPAKQNPNIEYMRLTNSLAARYKGNANNTFAKLVPIGEGLAKYSVVQTRKSFANMTKDALAAKFGKSKVVEGAMGPELVVDSAIIKYNPAFLAKKTPALTTTGQAIPSLETVLGNMGKTAPATLGQQALKYNSAEEFINNQGAPFYHGGEGIKGEIDPTYTTKFQKESGTDKYKKGFSLSSNKEVAADYWKNIEEVFISPNAKIANPKDLPEVKFTKFEDGSIAYNQEDAVKIAKEKGFDGVNLDAFEKLTTDPNMNVETQIFNKDIIKTKKELQEIWQTAQQTKIENINKNLSIDPYTRARLNRKNAITSIDKNMSVEVPTLMAKPLKGFENSLVTNKQADQVLGLSAEKDLPSVMVQAVVKSITGKDSLYELTQEEAYDVSESVRMFGNVKDLPESTLKVLNTSIQSFTHPARYWMETAEREYNIPLYSEGYLAFETAGRLSKVFKESRMNEYRDNFGKYSSVNDADNRRLVYYYAAGDKSVIMNNPSLTPEAKMELSKIGDYTKSKMEEFFKLNGITSERWFGHYMPQIRAAGGIQKLYKSKNIPDEVKPFFEFEREGSLNPLEDDALTALDIYTSATAKKLFFSEPIKNSRLLISRSPERVGNAFNDYVQEKLGYQDAVQEWSDRFAEKLSKNTKGFIPEDINKQTMDFLMTTSYAGALGLPRIMPLLRDGIQPLITTYPDLGPKWFGYGVKQWAKKGSTKELKDKGFLVEMGVPYGAELSAESGRGWIGKTVDFYKKLNKLAMKPYGAGDARNRAITYYGVKGRFEDAWNAFNEGKIDYTRFEQEIDMAGFNPTLRKVLNQKFSENTAKSLEEAQDLMAMDILDRTQFPYRRGSESRAYYGLRGKLGLQFAQWSHEYLFTLKSWAARGQWDKILRWYAMSEGVKRSIEESTNISAEKWAGVGPFSGFPLGPIAKIGSEFIGMINSAASGMDEEVNKSWKDITNAVKIYGGILTGVGAQKIANFMQSVKRYETGNVQSTDPDPEKKFGIWSTTGKLIRWVSFAELLQTLMGFESKSGKEQSERISRAQKSQIEYQANIDKAMNYLIDGDYDKFDKVITKNGIMMPDIANKMKSYVIPLDQRIFERLPLPLKDKYFNAFYPTE